MPTPSFTVPGLHGPFLQRQLPGWLKYATPADLKRLRERQRDLQADDAAPPAEHQRLRDDQVRCRRSTQALANLLKGLKGIAEFTEPLFKARLASELSSELDMHSDQFVLIHYEAILLGPMLRTVAHSQSLLQAALQNFATTARFDQGTALAPQGAFSLRPVPGDTRAQPQMQYHFARILNIDPQAFARLCHQLDLGGQYQQHLSEVYDAPATRAKLRSAWIAVYQDQLRVAAQFAFMHGDISEPARQMLLDLLAGSTTALWHGQPVRCVQVEMFRAPLAEVLVFSADRLHSPQVEPVLVYMPGSPTAVLKEYPSAQAAHEALRRDLRVEAFQTQLKRTVAQADLAYFCTRLGKLLEHPDARASLHLQETPIEGELFGYLYARHLQRIRDDARVLAVPSASADEKARRERLAFWENIGLDVLNVAAFFVPGLGEVMAAVAGVQLLDEVIEGAQAWASGDRDEAWAHLQSVGLNIAVMAGIGLAGHGLAKVVPSRVMDDLLRVVRPDGQTRLWQPALAPYACDVDLSGITANTHGQYALADKTFIRIDGHSVQIAPASDGQWRIQHPLDHSAYAPAVHGNGQGTWQVEGETPLLWPRVQLLRRIGHRAQGLDDALLLKAGQVSGIDDAVLRQMHLDHERIPPLLADALQQLQTVAGIHHPAGPALTLEEQRLSSDFALLPQEAVRELVEHAPSADRRLLMQAKGRVPLRLAEEARRYQRQVRLNRALLGLAEPRLASRDSERLALQLLPALPGWTGNVRLEVREFSLNGPLQVAVGRLDGELKTLVRQADRYDVYDVAEGELAMDEPLFKALLSALPDAERDALGLQIHAHEALAEAVFTRAVTDRARASRLLGQQPIRPWLRAPMRLADGRVGYPMGGAVSRFSATIRRLRALYPHMRLREVQQLRGRLRTAGFDLDRAIAALEHEYSTLEQTLNLWVAEEHHNPVESAARTAINMRIRQAWRRAGEGAQVSVLDLSRWHVRYLPTLNARFEHIEVLNLSGMTLTDVPEGFLQAFGQVRELSLRLNRLSAIPVAVGRLPRLRALDMSQNRLYSDDLLFAPLDGLRRLQTLRLNNNRLSLGTAELETLAGLPLTELNLSGNQIMLRPETAQAFSGFAQLRYLVLSHNPLGLAPELAALVQLQQLQLVGCRLSEWPSGLSALMDREGYALRRVDLGDNDIRQLPDLAATRFGAQLQMQDHRTYWLHLSENPLDENSSAHLQALGFERQGNQVVMPTEDWLLGASIEQRTLWRCLFDDAANAPLRNVLSTLSLSREFAQNGVDLRRRVWAMLEQVEQESALRDELVAIAARFPATCGDAGADAFSELEVAVLAYRCSLEAGSESEHANALLHLYRQLFRRNEVQRLADRLALRRELRRAALLEHMPAPALDPLDDIGDEQLTRHSVDDIEIRLALRQDLASELDYPEPSRGMHYDNLANLSADTAWSVAQAVARNDTQALRQPWLVEQPGWQRFLKQRFATQFEVLTAFWSSGLEYLDACLDASQAPLGKLDVSVRNVLGEFFSEPLLDAQGQLRRLALDDGRYLVAANALRDAHAAAETELILSLTRSFALKG